MQVLIPFTILLHFVALVVLFSNHIFTDKPKKYKRIVLFFIPIIGALIIIYITWREVKTASNISCNGGEGSDASAYSPPSFSDSGGGFGGD